MKYLTMLIYIVAFFYSASTYAYNVCTNPNANRVATWALEDLQEKILPDEVALDNAEKDPDCAKNWFERIFVDYNSVEGGFYGGCGLSIPFQSEKAMEDFALKLHKNNHGRDYVEIADIYAWISVPICGYVKSQSENE